MTRSQCSFQFRFPFEVGPVDSSRSFALNGSNLVPIRIDRAGESVLRLHFKCLAQTRKQMRQVRLCRGANKLDRSCPSDDNTLASQDYPRSATPPVPA